MNRNMKGLVFIMAGLLFFTVGFLVGDLVGSEKTKNKNNIAVMMKHEIATEKGVVPCVITEYGITCDWLRFETHRWRRSNPK